MWLISPNSAIHNIYRIVMSAMYEIQHEELNREINKGQGEADRFIGVTL